MLKKHESSLLWVALCLLFLQALMPTMAYRITAIHEHDDGHSVASRSYSDLKTTQEFRSGAMLQGAGNDFRPAAAMLPDAVFSQHVAASHYPYRFFRQVFVLNGYARASGSPFIPLKQSRAPPFETA